MRGSTASFVIVVSNAGPGTATGVTLSDPLPDGGLSWTVLTVTGTSTLPTCSVTNGTLSCTAVDIASGESYTVTVQTATDSNDCGVKNNPAATASARNHPDVSDLGSLTIPCADLSVTKTVDNATPNEGATISFTVSWPTRAPTPPRTSS